MSGPSRYPTVLDPTAVGTYPAQAKAGGGFVWDEVLEYRVWFSPRSGAEDLADGSDYFHAFETASEATAAAERSDGAAEPLALVLQREYIDESVPGHYVHVLEERVAEWPLEFLSRPRRDADTIPAFLAPDAPANRLDILRGLAHRSVSRRVQRRIDRDFATRADAAEVSAVVAGLGDSERMQAAVVICAGGSVSTAHEAAQLGHIDWRDLLVNAGLANTDWPHRLVEEFGPKD